MNDQMEEYLVWAHSDLLDSINRGSYAEFMVHRLLCLPTSSKRISKADHDFVLPNATRVEVKTCAFWHRGRLFHRDGSTKDPSTMGKVPVHPTKIRFGGLKARYGSLLSRPYGNAAFKSDVYIFCFQSEVDVTKWDAQDLKQWEFYVMKQSDLVNLHVHTSVSLAVLRKCRSSMSAEQFSLFMKEHHIKI